MLSAMAVSTATAQSSRSADSLLKAGAIAPTEAVLYEAVRTKPHDPAPRLALGRFLIARGATRVGMTLLEEAIRFGGSAAAIEPDLVHAYLIAGEYRSLAALSSAPAPQRERARWLVAHESRVVAPDSILSIPFRAAADSVNLGRVELRVNGHTLDATISARTSGITISDTSSVARLLQVFAGDVDGRTLAAADSVGLGRLSLLNLPIALAHVDGGVALIGLDVLGAFVPTFDSSTGRMTLRVGGPRADLPNGTRFFTWNTNSDLQLLQAGGWISVTRPSVVRMLRDHRWTLDSRRGQLIVER